MHSKGEYKPANPNPAFAQPGIPKRILDKLPNGPIPGGAYSPRGPVQVSRLERRRDGEVGGDGGGLPSTDLEGWRILVGHDSHGQHRWVYLWDEKDREEWPIREEERFWLGLKSEAPDIPSPQPGDYLGFARRGFDYYKQVQSWDGHWAGEYGGPLFLIPGLVIALYVTGQELRPEQRSEMCRYLLNKRRPEGGWGLHTAAPPTAYGTIMNYVALRILGKRADDPVMVEIREWVHSIGGATCAPSWAKAWLSVLGCYEWEGLNPVPPELWLLPEWVPIHPWRWWIHTRNVYIPIGYLYGRKWVGPITPLVEELRGELYVEPYDSIDFTQHRNNICDLDNYSPHHPIMDALNFVTSTYEPCALPPVRRAAVNAAYKLVVYEDENTGYQTIGPVSKAFHIVCRFAEEGPDSEAFKQHLLKIDDFLWQSNEGLMMCGTNGSQLWDAAFMAQALVETGLAEEPQNKEACEKVLDWLDKCQIRDDPRWYKEAYRHTSKGAWPFSTPEQSYTVSDCTAEGLKGVIALQSLSYTAKPVDSARMRDAVDVLLSMPNGNGGFASYELVRASNKIEVLNAAEVFGNIMTEYTYPECTTSALSALLHFSKLEPTYRRKDIENVAKKAVRYLHNEQRKDGSWFGSWGICFTYATMFALESLHMAGESYENSESVRRACNFLVSKQMDDGGWGETYMSCVTGIYHQHEQSQVVHTAWSILSLIYAGFPDKQVIRRAADLIASRQQSNGSWKQEDVEGIFNKNCGIYYPNFKFSFTIWALGRAHKYLKTGP